MGRIQQMLNVEIADIPRTVYGGKGAGCAVPAKVRGFKPLAGAAKAKAVAVMGAEAIRFARGIRKLIGDHHPEGFGPLKERIRAERL